MYTHIHADTHTCMHTLAHLLLRNWYNWHVADLYCRHYSNGKGIILRSLLWKRLLHSGNCMNLRENGDQGNKEKAKEVGV